MAARKSRTASRDGRSKQQAPGVGRREAARSAVRALGSFRTLSAAGVLAAVVLMVSANVLVSRFYTRWDWTSAGLYTLSQATVDTLQRLKKPVDVIVFLSKSDPLTLSVRHMLDAYGAETTQLRARYVDPDAAPAEFLALQQKYGIVAGKSEDGRVVTDASIVIAQGDKHWYVTTDDIVVYDEDDGRARPHLEQALTEGLRNVLEQDRARICFTTGHQEISIDDGGPAGLAELRYRLEKNNYEISAVDLSSPKPSVALAECRLVVVAGPEQPLDSPAAARLAKYFQGGGNLLLLANPGLDEDNRIRNTGLSPVTDLAGLEFGNDFIVERDDSLRLPTGLGESFFAVPVRHPVTRGLLRDEDRIDFKVLLSAAQSLREKGKGSPRPLLKTSPEAFSVRDIRPFVEEGTPAARGPGDPGGPFSVAMAAELPKLKPTDDHGPRMVAVGSAVVAYSRNWREPTLIGSRRFMESAISWLTARPAIVSVPEKPSYDVGLSLTEESLGEVWRYVILYMPGTAVLLGAFILLRRRSAERRSRRGKGRGKPDEAKKKDTKKPHGKKAALAKSAKKPPADSQEDEA